MQQRLVSSLRSRLNFRQPKNELRLCQARVCPVPPAQPSKKKKLHAQHDFADKRDLTRNAQTQSTPRGHLWSEQAPLFSQQLAPFPGEFFTPRMEASLHSGTCAPYDPKCHFAPTQTYNRCNSTNNAFFTVTSTSYVPLTTRSEVYSFGHLHVRIQ